MDADTMPDAEAALLGDAIGVPLSALAMFSREPLGDGTVAGFSLEDGTIAYVDTSLLAVRRETGFMREGEARVWIHPADPHLPALAPAAFGDAVAVLLARLGIAAAGMPELVGYRAGRRAVLRVATDESEVWVKVVTPRRIECVVNAHVALRAHGLPVPAVRGWSPEGLLVLDAADGIAATEGDWDAGELLTEVARLRARLADASLAWPARTSLAQRLPWYAERLRAALPEHDDRLHGLQRRIAAALAPAAEQVAGIHGDLHLGQLFLRNGRITGLIDVDTAGRGAPGEDAAAFIAHTVASALLTEQQGPGAAHVRALAVAAHAAWGGEASTRGLLAVHLCGHSLGAMTAGDRERAERLLVAAEQSLDEGKNPLMPALQEP